VAIREQELLDAHSTYPELESRDATAIGMHAKSVLEAIYSQWFFGSN
jgi:hypothetical protein